MALDKDAVMPLLLAACPSFQRPWDEFCASGIGDGLLYVALGEFAVHVGLQNVAGDAAVRFAPFLREQTARWWRELDRFWAGEVPHVGAGLK